MSYVDPATEGGLPQSGGVIGHEQADTVIEDIELMEGQITSDAGSIGTLTTEVAALEADETAQQATNASVSSEISSMQAAIAALQLFVNSLGGGAGGGDILTTTLVVNTPYNASFTSNFTSVFAVASGGLPPGLTLSTSGVLSGTPTTTGIYEVSVSATQAGESVISPAFTITVLPNTNISSTEAQIGTYYVFTFTSSETPTTFSVSSGSLPPNMTLTPAGVLSGTPTTAGNYTFTLTASDLVGTITTPTLSIVVATSAAATVSPVNVSTPLISGTPQVNQVLVASDGSWTGAPYNYSYQWNLNGVPISGATSNTYTVITADEGGSLNCTITATNIIGSTSINTAGISIPNPPPVGTAPVMTADTPPTTAYVGEAYSYSFTATGTPAPTFSVVSGGTLPPGLTLLNSGLLSGTPTTVGTYAFTIEASNTINNAVSSNIAIVISAVVGPNITSIAPPAGSVGASYTYTFNVTGTPAPTLSINTGSLPPGISLNDYTISGIPTTAATYTFTLFASNQGGNFTSTSISITIATSAPVGTVPVNATPPVITDITSGNYIIGDTISFTTGGWSESPTAYTYQVNHNGTAIQGPIAGATGSITPGGTGTYVLASGDLAYPLTVTVTAANADGPGLPATSASTPPVGAAGGAPVASAIPVIYDQTTAGAFVVGDTIGIQSNGTWSGSPTTYYYAWHHIAPGATSSTIVSQGGADTGYVLAASDAGYLIYCIVYATNSSGQGESISAAHAVLTSGTAIAPTITGQSPPAATISTAYTYTFSATGSTPITWSSIGTLPPGLALGGTTGTLSGTPTSAGTYTFTVTATNSVGSIVSNSISITVAASSGGGPPAGSETFTELTSPLGANWIFYSDPHATAGYTTFVVSATANEPFTVEILGSPDGSTTSVLSTQAATLSAGTYSVLDSISITTTYVTVEVINGTTANTSMNIVSTLETGTAVTAPVNDSLPLITDQTSGTTTISVGDNLTISNNGTWS